MIKNIFKIIRNKYHRSKMPYSYSKMDEVYLDTYNFCKTISSDFDTVIAIPRSGLIIGSTISTYFGKPLSTPEMITENKRWISKQNKLYNSNLDFYNTIILVDDFVWSGKQLQEATKLIKENLPNVKIKTAALYINSELTRNVNYYYKTIKPGSLHHWDYNLMHGKPGKIAYDLDGVLCFDWDNASDYETHLKIVKPFRIPLYSIDCILTARLERYRTITEKWLQDHNVKYNKLYMRRNESQDVVKFKSEILLKEKPELYIESHPFYANLIHIETGLTVVCTDNNTMYR